MSLCESRDRDLCGDRCVRPIRTDPGSIAACAPPFLPQVTHDTAPVTSPDGQLALTLSGVGSKESGVGGGCCPGVGLITRRRLPGGRAYQVSATWGGGGSAQCLCCPKTPSPPWSACPEPLVPKGRGSLCVLRQGEGEQVARGTLFLPTPVLPNSEWPLSTETYSDPRHCWVGDRSDVLPE